MPVTAQFAITNFSTLALSLGVKVALLVIVFIYSIFSFLVIRQVRTMEKTVATPLSIAITTIAILDLVATVILLFAILIFV